MAILVAQVENEDFFLELLEVTNAFWKVSWTSLRHLPELVCNGTRVRKSFAVTLDEVSTQFVSTLGGGD